MSFLYMVSYPRMQDIDHSYLRAAGHPAFDRSGYEVVGRVAATGSGTAFSVPAFHWRPARRCRAVPNGDITAHSAAPELRELTNAVGRTADRGTAQTPTLTVAKRNIEESGGKAS
ncbi:MAG: hypothetical protein U5R46_06160 [Gammaproteobacteria bacterium]|nr:hypothetical protein [Gammaproteobacteria bacterium]